MRIFDNPSISAALVCGMLAFTLAGCGERNSPAAKSTDVTPPVAAQQIAPADATPAKTAATPKTDPDADLAAKVKAAFASDPQLKMLPIDVRASNGAVTLYGTADSTKLRDKAIHTAETVDGVKSVSANLPIVRGS